VRPFIGPSAPELHDLRWERLRDPLGGAPLLTTERILFSRYLSSAGWRRVCPHPRHLAPPRRDCQLEQSWRPGHYPLAQVDVPGDLPRTTAAPGDAVVTPLSANGSATHDGIIAGVTKDTTSSAWFGAAP
jgi:hypothetical protein